MRVCFYGWYCPHILVNMNLCGNNPSFRVPLVQFLCTRKCQLYLQLSCLPLIITQKTHTETHMYGIKQSFYLIDNLMSTSPLAINVIFSGLFNFLSYLSLLPVYSLWFIFGKCFHFPLTLGRWCTISFPALHSQGSCHQFADLCLDIPFTLGAFIVLFPLFSCQSMFSSFYFPNK